MPRPLFDQVLNLRKTFNLPVRAISASQTITTPEQVWVVDTTGGNVTLTLPPTQQTRGHFIYFVKSVVANSLTVQRAGADVIGYAGATSVVLAAGTPDLRILLISDGAGTWIKVLP